MFFLEINLRANIVVIKKISPLTIYFQNPKVEKLTGRMLLLLALLVMLKKGGKLYSKCDLRLKRKPFIPTVDDLHINGRNFPPNFLHESWMDYLYWDIELEP